MINLLSRQLALLIGGLFTLSILTFSITQLFPEDAFVRMHPNADTLNAFEEYFAYLNRIISGDWGLSQIRGSNVLSEFLTFFPATLELTLSALLFSLALGLPLGVYAAQHKNHWQDKLVVSSTLVGYSMPIFWWGMLLVLLFSLSWGLTPVAGRIGFEYDILPVTGFMLVDTLLSDQSYSLEAFYDALHHLLLPAIVLGTIPLAIFTRVTRSAMLKVLSSDYIRTAKAKGLPHSRIIWVHALRNAFIPILTVIGLQVSVLITGTLITETIFSWPGIGKWLLEAVYRRDFITLHAGLLAIAAIIIFLNILVEIISHYMNPKLRLKQ